MNRGPVLLVVVAVVVAAMGVWVWSNLNPDAPLIAEADRARITVLPLPTDLALRDGSLSLTEGMTVELVGHTEPRLARAVDRMRSRLPARAGNDGPALLEIDVGVAADDSDPTWIDESYALDVTPDGARLRAITPVGAIRGLQTFLQLVEMDTDGVRVPAARIRDAPRFRWRGLMIDVCRHWIPKEVLLRNLDAMEAAKMNVLHLHLTEDQAFRVESLVHPRLHEVGSGGSYLTQDDLREIVAYAHDRGIRVVPEFDLPGHSAAWLEAYPELAIDEGPWVKSKRYGIHPVALDPTRDEVYEFIDAFLGEMAEIFPDPFVHVGGDEANPDRWNASERVRTYMDEQGLEDHEALQAHFNLRLHGILAKHGKRMMGWEEIQHEDLPQDAVVQAWLMPGSVAKGVAGGYETVLSQGYYLDHKLPASKHYEVDPLGLPEPVEIDTTGAWQSFAITLDTPAGEIEGNLVVLGEDDDVRAVMSAAGRVIWLEEVRFEGGHLTGRAETPLGAATFDGHVEGEVVRGSMGSLVFSVDFEGARTGGHDVAGTSAPELVAAIEIPPEHRYRVLGGEAAMWSEVVTAQTIDSRIWPRTAAIAERLWSPAESTADVDDMYRRLEAFSERLDALGLRHESYREELLRGIAGGPVPPELRTFVAALEEVKGYARHRSFSEGLTTETPLDRVADAAAAESDVARRFNGNVAAFVAGDDSRRDGITAQLRLWQAQYAALGPSFDASERLAAVEAQSRALAAGADLALDVMNGSRARCGERGAILAEMEPPADGAMLAVTEGIGSIVASGCETRGGS